MRTIPLTQGKHAIVDEDVYDELCKRSWWVSATGYAFTTSLKHEGKKTNIAMHRLIVGAKKGEYVDHINGNKLDNRRENLRIVSQAQNMANTKKYVTNKSGYKGVHFHAITGKYRAMISVGNKSKHIGLYNTPEEAALAYNEAALKLRGEYARLNKIE